MSDRSQNLIAIRPLIPTAKVSDNMSAEEHFQNKTLRPIIKLQNELFLGAFQNYIAKRKNVFYELPLQKRMDYIAHAIQKDLKFRNSLKGMVIGQYTLEEYEIYMAYSSALNKRMMNMVIKRLQDQIQFFERIELAV
ncbi:glyoxalase [Aggregatimonas sangjinii]|uniref:Glyoxalase n=1 Tax=Aggregatimonas sangjinii TaxID=2583587 RepID=A0A5B7SPH2_9FLAO|nr:glyoxalase [Aggregatimonas sangjinii]QCX00082.1 glyoxalase [Aggregatimonas sangjinii]